MSGGRVRFPREVSWVTSAATRRDVWLKARRDGVGGSDVAALLGTSPWSTPMQVWLEKTGRTGGEQESERMRWGQLLEATVAAEWASRESCKVRRLGTIADPHRPWRMASLDRAVIVPGTLDAAALLEVKTTSERSASEMPDAELVDRYRVQANWYLGITGLDVAHLAVLVGGQELRTPLLRFDPDLWEESVQAADAFWRNHVLADAPPPVSPGDSGALNGWGPADTGAVAVADDGIGSLIGVRRLVKAEHDSLEGDLELIDAAIKAHMGAATELAAADGTSLATWREQRTTRIDTDRLKADGIYDDYIRRGTTRVLRIKKGVV